MPKERRLVDVEGWVLLSDEYLQTFTAAHLATPAPLIPLGAVSLPQPRPMPHAAATRRASCGHGRRQPQLGPQGPLSPSPGQQRGSRVRRGQGPVK